MLWWKSNFKLICFALFSLRRFNGNRELIPHCWRSYRESTFANIELFRNKNMFGNGCSKGTMDIREMIN